MSQEMSMCTSDYNVRDSYLSAYLWKHRMSFKLAGYHQANHRPGTEHDSRTGDGHLDCMPLPSPDVLYDEASFPRTQALSVSGLDSLDNLESALG